MKPKLGRTMKKAMPTILSCIGAVGVAATAVLAVKATPKALERIQKATNIKMRNNSEKMTRLETIEACWQCYIPAAATGIATIGCIFGANVLNRRQQASLASAYALLNRSYTDYKRALRENYGEEAHKRIMKSLAVEKTDAPVIYGSMSGKDFSFEDLPEETCTFYDAFSERYFQATPSQVLLAELHANRNLALGGEVALKTFYDFLGLSTPDEMRKLSWWVSDYYQWIDFTHTKVAIDDGFDREPVECWIIEMDFPPTPEPLEY